MVSSSVPYAPNTEGLSYVPFDELSDHIDRFNAKTTILNKGNFAIPGQGQQPDYCHKQFVSHIHNEGTSALKMLISCRLARCPTCYKLWVDNEVYKYAVLLESYALYVSSRPARVIGSISTDRVKQGVTLTELRAFKRNSKDRLLRCGVTAGFGLEHAFRIKKYVQDAIRAISDKNSLSSGAFWTFITSQEGIDNINDYLDTDFKTWRDCVSLSPHVHYLTFPGQQQVTGDKDIVLKKLSTVVDGNKVYTLDTVDDIVHHIRYLIGHCGVLTNAGKHKSKPTSLFGDLFMFNPLEHLTLPEYNRIKDSVLCILNEGRSTPLIEGADGDLLYKHEDQEHEGMANYLPIKEFVAYDAVSHEAVDAWIASIDDSANMAYCEYLITTYSDILKDPDRPNKCRRLFVEDLRDPRG